MRPDIHQAAAQANITWISPQANETLLAGQNYTASWNASYAPSTPTFQLCVEQGGEPTEGSCGAWVTVPVQVDSGSYFVSLTLPNVSSTDPFILRMHDDPNPDSVSPLFSIHAASPSNDISTTPSPVPQAAQAPGLSFQLPHQTNSTDTPLILPMPSNAPRLPRAKRELQVPDFFPHPTPMFIAFSVIPIVLLVAALITFVVIWVRQRRNGQLKRLYLTEHPMIYPRRPVPKSLASNEDLEDAVQTLEYERFRSEKAHMPAFDEKQGPGSRIMEKRMKRRGQENGEEGGWRVPAPAGPRAIPPHHAHERGYPVSSPSTMEASRNEMDAPQQRTSYVPEPRDLTASYFPPALPPLDLPSHTARDRAQGTSPITPGEGIQNASGRSLRHSDDELALDDYGHGVRLVESPIPMGRSMSSMPIPMAMGMSPPPPSVTKLSERLHVRRRSESGGRSRSGRGREHGSQGELTRDDVPNDLR